MSLEIDADTAGELPFRLPGEVESRCRALLHRMYEFVDGGRAEEAIGLFSADAVFQTPTRTNRGTEEIQAALAKRQAQRDRRTRHVVTNLRLWSERDGSVRSTGTLVLFVLSGPNPMVPSRIAEIHDEFICHEGEWTISSHGSTLLADCS
ncbi:nuclear transport factor 2 family protein [Rhodococcus sp. MSC1_016]|jgi:hypothetical protein|uniref:nuclear transport factor 2 family protein n=1 Tax=Rhodococcus sp. MSC1_016 TaxID=2909266 RepID=UPI0035B1EB53